MREVYAPVIAEGTPVVVTDLATAQLVKVAANAFLATKISFINAMAEVCEVTHADVKKLSEALSHDTRIGGRFLHAGLGFGGGCLPKDIRAFMARAGELGVDQALSFLTEVDAINLRRRARMVDLARELLDDSLRRPPGRRARRGVQARTATTSATPPRSTSPTRLQQARRRRHGLRPGRDGQRPAALPRPDATPTSAVEAARGRRHRAAPHRVAGVPRAGPGGAVRRGRPAQHRRRPQRARPRALARTPAGPTARSAGPDGRRVIRPSS